MTGRELDSKRVVKALRASQNAKSQWFKDYWYGVATKICEKYA